MADMGGQGSLILRPDLALRGYDAVERVWPMVGSQEAFLREKVLATAQPLLVRSGLEAGPKENTLAALRASGNLLSPHEKAHAIAWATNSTVEEIRSAMLDLIHGTEPILDRARRFLVRTALKELGEGRKAGVNVTVTTYLLGMSNPGQYAFVKPDLAFHPAFTMLCTRAGEPAPATDGAERIDVAARFYGELRSLWKRERGFQGDLLDVHTRLFCLGPRHHSELPGGWAAAMSAEITGAMAREHEAATPKLMTGLEAASKAMAAFIDPARPDILGGLDVAQYAYGRGPSLCYLIEYSTRDYIPLRLGSAYAHEVGFLAAGNWRLASKEGFSDQEAAEYFEKNVKPRLAELAEMAKAFIAGNDCPLTKSGKLWVFRGIDAKTFCLFVVGLNPAVARDRLTSVVKPERLLSLGRFLGVDVVPIHTVRDYFEMQRRIGAALERLPPEIRPTAHGLASWSFNDLRGQQLAALLEPGPADDGSDVDAADIVPPVLPPDTGGVVVPPPPLAPSWDDLFGRVDPDLKDLARLLRSRRNVVLYGPPGTGKTFKSVALARAWRAWQGDGEDPASATVEQVTFHPSYGYEDFIEAYRPSPSEPGRFELQPGILPRLADRAHSRPQQHFLLLIDELNRGDVARIFGELITLLEADKRSPDHARRRMLSGQPLYLPGNLYVLGTMNTADKSISLMDVAVRRRFAFVLTPPRPDLLNASRGLVQQVGSPPIRLATILEALNRRLLAMGVLPDRLLGHALLWIKADVDDPLQELGSRFRWDIIPLVEEYCFSDRGSMRQVLGPLVDDRGLPREEVLDSAERLLQALAEIVSTDG